MINRGTYVDVEKWAFQTWEIRSGVPVQGYWGTLLVSLHKDRALQGAWLKTRRGQCLKALG